MHDRKFRFAAGTLSMLLTAVALGGCNRAAEELKQRALGAATDAVGDKVRDVVAEKVVEKATESMLEKEGMKNAKVDLGDKSNTVSVTDKDGKQFTMGSGNAAQLNESDFGIPFYPGAKIDQSKAAKMVSTDAFQYSVEFGSSDKLDKIAAFYRDKLKAVTGDRKYMEMAEDTSKITFMLVDEKKGGMTGVTVEQADGEDATITLVANGKTPAAAKPAKRVMRR
jgi:hypothetical protein